RRRHPRQRDRPGLRRDRSAAGVARERRRARDDRAPAHPPDPGSRADRPVRRIPPERRVGRRYRHPPPPPRRPPPVAGAPRRDRDDAGGILMSEFATMLHAGPATFFGRPLVTPEREALRAAGARVALLGVPWDEGNGGRNGANYGPRAARDVSSWFL